MTGCFKPKTISGSIFSERGCASASRGGVAVTVMHGVVVHVGPNQGFKFEHTPHGLIGITNLAADGSVSTSLAEPLEYCFNFISRVEIEAGARRGKGQ